MDRKRSFWRKKRSFRKAPPKGTILGFGPPETAQDLDAIAERLRAHGIESDGPRDASWGGRMLNVTDPDGFQITLTREQE